MPKAESKSPVSGSSPPPNTPNPESDSSGSASPPASNARGRIFRTAAERKAQLLKDIWIDSSRVFPKKVRCLGCGKDVKLDMRTGAEYYHSMWNKHKIACSWIKEGKRKDEEDLKAVAAKRNIGMGDGKPRLPEWWTPASLEGGLTMTSTTELLRVLRKKDDLVWGRSPSPL